VDGGRNPLMLKVFPLIAVTSVTLIAPDGTTIALSQGTDFEINPDTGMIYRLDDIYQQPRDWSPMQTVVVYQAGYLLPNQTASNYPATAQTVPDDLEDAVGRMIYSRYVERSRDPFLKRVEDPRVGVKEYWIGGTPGQDGALTDDIREILDKYRVPMVG
jgi:hypothetical protein